METNTDVAGVEIGKPAASPQPEAKINEVIQEFPPVDLVVMMRLKKLQQLEALVREIMGKTPAVEAVIAGVTAVSCPLALKELETITMISAEATNPPAAQQVAETS